MTYIKSIGSSLSHLYEYHCVDILVGVASLQTGKYIHLFCKKTAYGSYIQ